MIPKDGGSAVTLVAGRTSSLDPTWGPRGEAIAFTTGSDGPIKIIDLKTRKIRDLPDSSGFATPKWSPDGRIVAATRRDSSHSALFDVASRSWRTVVKESGHYLHWTPDSRRLVYLSAGVEAPQLRYLDIGRQAVSSTVELKGLRRPTFPFGDWIGLGPGETPLAVRDLSSQEIQS